MSKDLGIRLEDLRKYNNLTIEDLAEKLSVNRHDVRHWEDGTNSPDSEQLIKLSNIYEMPIDEILLNFDTENNFKYSHGNSETSEPSKTPDPSEAANFNDTSKKTYNWHMFPYPIIVTFAYIIIGIFFNKWHPTWLLFLTVPIYYTLVEMNKAKGFKKKANIFPYPIICVLFYLSLGFDYSLWHPMWIIFFTVPVYYMIVNGFRD